MRLEYSAISDVGRVRKDNQDSGYAGPWLLAVCDGVGGAARGDVASSTAISMLRRLDEPPADGLDNEHLLGEIAGALHRAHDRIAELVDDDPALGGTSTTATLARFDGNRVGIGHVGDSRAYLFRSGELSRLTRDHTFVQGLIDEGRISEEEARVHPHRNLILNALDAQHEVEPDLFVLELEPGDRLLLCSDGASGVLDDGRLADILSGGTPDYAAVELVRASLEAGSSDNVTCIVADVREEAAAEEGSTEEAWADGTPLLVGAAGELRRRMPRGAGSRSIFRGHRSGDTGELEPVEADLPESVGRAVRRDPDDQVDPEQIRYAPRPPARFRWLRRLMVLLLLLGAVWVLAAAGWSWTQRQYFVGEQEDRVVIFRGVQAEIPGMDLATPYETTNVDLARLSEYDAGRVRAGIETGSLADARRTVENLAAEMTPAETAATEAQ